MMKPSKEFPLSRLAAGDDDALRDCFAVYGALVRSLARRACPDAASAEDAMQEVFVDLWRSAARYDPTRAPERTFVAMIARRRLIDLRRSRRKHPDLEPLSSALEDAFALASVERHAEVSQLWRVLRGLRPEALDILALSLSKGLSHEEIASRTGACLGTVKSKLRRGLQQAQAAVGSRATAVGAAAVGAGAAAVGAGAPEPRRMVSS